MVSCFCNTKRPALLLLIFFLLVQLISCGNNEDFVTSDFTISNPNGDALFLHDMNSGDTFYSAGGADTRIYPASITKLATASFALEIIDSDCIIQPGDEVYLPAPGSSSAYIRPHHQLSLEMLIEGMLIPSGNDAAYAVAVAGGRALIGEDADIQASLDAFIVGLNEYLINIGCTGTNFTCPDGYTGDEHYSTLGDMLLIVQNALKYDEIAKYVGLHVDEVTYASGHTNTWVNTNKLLDKYSDYYHENICGIKTGSLEGNFSIVTWYNDSEKSVLIGVFGANKDSGRYTDTVRIIDELTKAPVK